MPVPLEAEPHAGHTHDTPLDDRYLIAPGDQGVLIVQDDVEFANMLLAQVRTRGMKGVVSFTGDAALSLARDYLPIAIPRCQNSCRVT